MSASRNSAAGSKKKCPARKFGIFVLLVAIVGVAYTVYRSFRTDDELWIASPEEPSATEG